jgi:hypothetical protein
VAVRIHRQRDRRVPQHVHHYISRPTARLSQSLPALGRRP